MKDVKRVKDVKVRSRAAVAIAISAVVCGAVAAGQQKPPPQQTPTFRSTVDISRVSVRDRKSVV